MFALCTAVAYLINWVAFVPSWLRRTERFYDLTGTLTYLTVVVIALVAGSRSSVAVVLGVLVAVWALRLGSFLVRRIRREGTDRRFDRIKQDPARFLVTWTLQALWVVLTAGAALAAMTSATELTLVTSWPTCPSWSPRWGRPPRTTGRCWCSWSTRSSCWGPPSSRR